MNECFGFWGGVMITIIILVAFSFGMITGGKAEARNHVYDKDE